MFSAKMATDQMVSFTILDCLLFKLLSYCQSPTFRDCLTLKNSSGLLHGCVQQHLENLKRQLAKLVRLQRKPVYVLREYLYLEDNGQCEIITGLNLCWLSVYLLQFTGSYPHVAYATEITSHFRLNNCLMQMTSDNDLFKG